MMYIIKMMDKTNFKITKEEYENILKAKEGLIFIKSNDATININSVSSIIPENLEEQTTGRLHDGTRVIKKYGKWVLPNRDTLKLDQSYYPEIARDEVMTEKEYQIKKIGFKKNEIVQPTKNDTNS